MNRDYNDCDIIFDLLPLYVDGKTSKESDAYVEEHFSHCENCREIFQFMQKDFGELHSKNDVGETGKRKKVSRIRIFMATVLGIYVIAIIVLICWLCFTVVMPVL